VVTSENANDGDVQERENQEKAEESHEQLVVGADAWAKLLHWIVRAVNTIQDFVRLLGKTAQVSVLQRQLLDLSERSMPCGPSLLYEVGGRPQGADGAPICIPQSESCVPGGGASVIIMLEVVQHWEDLVQLLASQRVHLLNHLLMKAVLKNDALIVFGHVCAHVRVVVRALGGEVVDGVVHEEAADRCLGLEAPALGGGVRSALQSIFILSTVSVITSCVAISFAVGLVRLM